MKVNPCFGCGQYTLAGGADDPGLQIEWADTCSSRNVLREHRCGERRFEQGAGKREWEPALSCGARRRHGLPFQGAGLPQPCGYHAASSPSQPNAGHDRPDFMHRWNILYLVYVNLPGRFPVHRRNTCAHKRVQNLYLRSKNTGTPSSLLNVQSSFRELNQRSTTAGYLNTLLRPVSPSS
ncbi:hypothetical protein M2315_004582 [Agrobacterium fabrum]|nr:hypothetical protein [Agrobacterium fabrum]